MGDQLACGMKRLKEKVNKNKSVFWHNGDIKLWTEPCNLCKEVKQLVIKKTNSKCEYCCNESKYQV